MNQRDIDELVAIAGREGQVMDDLDDALARLRETRQAKALLQTLPAEELRRALQARTRALALRVARS